MRMIDAERLMYSLRGNILIDVTLELEETIAQQPTAFDKEKVIDELKRMEEESCKEWNEYGDAASLGKVITFAETIEIVEKGGIE